MPQRRDLPETASTATPGDGARLHAPAAERNAAQILDLLRHQGPETGRVLELAAGTGQHAAIFAAALPGLEWQPSDIDPDRRASIDAWATTANAPNLRPAIELDATAPGWGTAQAGQNMILLVNLMHLISTPEAKTVIAEVAKALAPQGRFILYGPFLRDGDATSEGDARFDASLRAQDPEIGYKDDFDVIDWLHEAGLDLVDVVEMPANNLALVSQKAF
ncbi:DUF938 domain-containing protein [Roseovarius gahaiensis]|uniref:DUF938 domain-containing protein n=1 Tax=Roseovarius gahaiensis TaxID=2716691 RepID=A0A967EGK5_9RHOB|nr:DUF938 domain-containing protein [Roseovarius gahaiensis]NHQ74750.1 DUF938 domain-containing protein [Roseovarius gahaiensis]